MNLEDLVNKGILDLNPYKPGKPIEDLERELARLASNIFIDVNTLKNLCESNELDFSKIENQIKTELYWNSLIFEIYKHNLNI